jgi:osmotically-inducible protein OsmY
MNHEYDFKRSPRGGKISPGRSFYNDPEYGDREIYFEPEKVDGRVWDLEEMGVSHPNQQLLVGDEIESGFSGVGPKGYRRSDKRIYEDVCEALKRDSRVDASDIEVDVKEGHVHLKGKVKNRLMKKTAERSIEYVSGVEDIRNELSF